MRIATWNLESVRKLSPKREAAFLQSMAEVDADVWVLTETWVIYGPGAPYRLAAQSGQANDLMGRPDRCWVSIWVRSNLVTRTMEVWGQQDRMACGRIEMRQKQDVVVVGTVLPWAADKLWPGADGFCAVLEVQMAQWASLRGAPGACTFIAAGDFNQSLPHQRWYGSKKGEIALNNALKKHDLLCLTTGNVALANRPRIDHICAGRSALQSSFATQVNDWPIPTVNEKPITDHFGVFVDLDLLER